MRKTGFIILWALITAFNQLQGQQITFRSLLQEMGNRNRLATFPFPYYNSLQASSYNRASKIKGDSNWFADSDGIGFIRTEMHNGKLEWVVMEHEGPGAITRMWAPYFYYGGLDDLEGPVINIYLDGQNIPIISENYFKLITGKGSVPPPFARVTARAGDCYLPIPFAKSCKITFDRKPFYHIINYRAYEPATKVNTFSIDQLKASLPLMNEIARSLLSVYSPYNGNALTTSGQIEPAKEMAFHIQGPAAVNQLEIRLNPAQIKEHPELLRSVIITADFDGEQCVWAPLGDFFGSANSLNPFQTFTRTVNAIGQMVCTWVMPFKRSARFYIKNLGTTGITIEKFEVQQAPWKWDERSMYFHANWRSDDWIQGSEFKDWNFIDIKGKGVVVGDALTVLNPDYGWWGEGDEKIYVDDAWNKGFPTHFGTGTEDYYGWAGGENPSKDDLFSHPFLSNIAVGTATTRRRDVRGFNICTRVRALDAIPFKNRLVFDMEASAGVDIRNPWNYLVYSAIVFWYARPGAVNNRPALPEQAVKPLVTLKQIDDLEISLKKK